MLSIKGGQFFKLFRKTGQLFILSEKKPSNCSNYLEIGGNLIILFIKRVKLMMSVKSNDYIVLVMIYDKFYNLNFD